MQRKMQHVGKQQCSFSPNRSRSESRQQAKSGALQANNGLSMPIWHMKFSSPAQPSCSHESVVECSRKSVMQYGVEPCSTRFWSCDGLQQKIVCTLAQKGIAKSRGCRMRVHQAVACVSCSKGPVCSYDTAAPEPQTLRTACNYDPAALRIPKIFELT